MVKNRGPATRKAHRRCANPACPRLFRPERPARRYCCRQCSADCRPRASRVAAGKKGGANSGIKRRGESAERLRQRVAGLPPDQAFRLGRYIRKTDLFNAKQSARREGFADGLEQGYDQAMKELRWRRA